MNYQLVYTTRAKNDLHTATEYIAQQVPKIAERWFDGFVAVLAKLKHNPLIYGLAPESDQVGEDIRQIIYRTKSRRLNRTLYSVRDDTVYILCIRRPGQRLLTQRETSDLLSGLD